MIAGASATMFALPSLRNVPRTLSARADERHFAAMALEILPRKLTAPPPLVLQYGLDGPIERHALEWRLREELGAAMEALRIFDVKLNVHAHQDDVRVFLGNRGEFHLASQWRMQHRWRSLESKAPGLAGTALAALEHASAPGIPLYTPHLAMYFCETLYWRGESDERDLIEEMVACGETAEIDGAGILSDAEVERIAEQQGIPTRKWVDKAFPIGSRYTKPLPETRLASLARQPGIVGEVAAAVLHLREVVTAARRRKEPGFESQSSDEVMAFGFGAALRWNEDDPMARFIDDYGQMESEAMAVENVYGWYDYNPGTLPAIVKALHRRLEVARAVEELLPLIATEIE